VKATDTMDNSQKLASVAFVLALAAIPGSGRDLSAFSGAEGFGAKASGGRGGRVIAVTNLDDAGPDSLRAAIDEKGTRTIVFRVSENIPLNSSRIVGKSVGGQFLDLETTSSTTGATTAPIAEMGTCA
jgi:hypothetical protein